jgi:hypothetical protein
MNRMYFIWLITLIFATSASVQSQNDIENEGKLTVFIDCRNTRCDLNFIRTEITFVDFLLDRLSADVHILITSRGTGGGGRRYEMIFFGQNRLQQLRDTITYFEKPVTTLSESRELLVQHLKLGLVPFLIKIKFTEGINITVNQDSVSGNGVGTNYLISDPWNYWVITLRGDGNINGEKVYTSYGYNGNLSASRVTDELKVGFSLYGSNNRTSYTFETDTSIEKFVARTNNYGLSHYLVKSINSHWSVGYESIFNSNTFSNFKRQLYTRLAVEYNIFPYSQINDRYLAFSYGFVTRFNRYYDSTIYDKLYETLFAHSVRMNLALNKKWGTINAGMAYHNFFQNWALNSFTMNFSVNVRVTGGLSFYVASSGGLVHDQVYLAKSGATQQEVLTRIRQLKSSYYFQNRFGISYRFGSKLNNFVNPRFEGG